MAPTRRNKFLECFYCGRRSSMRYHGQRSFECASCDATNYLDENGEITDPPATATGASTPAKVTYAVSRTISPPRPSGSIFCETCLKNQQLFTASIAQYLPDDPDAPDYAEREKHYYEFRRRLEKIYPQICAECEPKVRKRIEQSAYTAKTDVLRRMIDQSKTNKIISKRSWLDVVHLAGRWLWIAGFVLQIASHTLGLSLAGLTYCAAHESVPPGCAMLRTMAVPLLRTLPEQERLLRWSFFAGLLSAWWNPRFVQTVRGFTKHLLGLSKWYVYQVMIVGVRLFSMRLVGHSTASYARTATAEGAIHLLLAAFAFMFFRSATTCVRVDTTPLFGAKTKIQLAPADSPQKINPVHTTPKPDGVKNMSDLLDEILESPSLSSKPLQSLSRPRTQPIAGSLGSTNFQPTSFARKPNLALDDLFLSEPAHHNHHKTPQQPASGSPDAGDQVGEEMDWSPSTSQHRAFSSFRGPDPANQGFSQAPTSEERRGAFWYRVPPAPVAPAHRLFNPPQQPRLRTIPTTTATSTSPLNGRGNTGFGKAEWRSDDGIFAAAAAAAAAVNDGRVGRVLGQEEEEGGEVVGTAGRSEVAFARPSFFPPTPGDDPRNGLVELLEGSFTLRQMEEEEKRRGGGGWIGGLFGGKT